MDLESFIDDNGPTDGTDAFELQSEKMLGVSVDGTIMTKAGSMVGYTGNVSFTRKSAGGVSGFLKQRATGEKSPMMEASGTGKLFLADQGKRVQILDLDEGEDISVNGNDILAFEDSVDWSLKTIDSIAGASAGGLFNIYLSGPGHVAVTTHGHPLVVPTPANTDPAATVAWSANVSPSIDTDLNVRSFLGRKSGESYQLEFSREGGFVIIQPFEERSPGQ